MRPPRNISKENGERFSDRFDKTPYSPDSHSSCSEKDAPSPRYRRSERYQKDGGLSPLRSPLRREEADSDNDRSNSRHREGYRRSERYSDRRDRTRDRNRQKPNNNEDKIDSRSDRKTDSKTDISIMIRNDQNQQPALREIEFPEIETARQLKFGASSGSRSKASREFEKPSAPAPRIQSWGSMCDLDEEEERLARVRDDIEKMKQRLVDPDYQLQDKDLDMDEASLIRKQKQIDFGKKTGGYQRYSKMYRKSERSKELPRTPNKFRKCSRRSWDMQVRIWRKSLHIFDPPKNNSDSRIVSLSDCSSLSQDQAPVKDSDSGITESPTSSCLRLEENHSLFSPGSSQNDADFDADLMDLALGNSSLAPSVADDEDDDFW